MRCLTYFALVALTSDVLFAARGLEPNVEDIARESSKYANHNWKRSQQPSMISRSAFGRSREAFLTEKTSRYQVDGNNIPDVLFDIGESYAGMMQISANASDGEIYFWFFPSDHPDASDETTVWFNGGPGCSSLEGLLQENGPFFMQYGTFAPVENPYAWRNLTNVVYVEFPIGTGFSRGPITIHDQDEAAIQFMGFWKNFVDTFDLKGRKVYLTGESYAGYYVHYIADAMFKANDTDYFNVNSTMLIDPSSSYDIIQSQIPAVQFVDYWKGFFPFNDSYVEHIHKTADKCGYTEFLNKYMTFPPPGPLPHVLPGTGRDGISATKECDIFWGSILPEVFNVNPCFNVYHVSSTCPVLWDVLGYPYTKYYTPPGASIYFDRTDVKKAMNAPVEIKWTECKSRNHIFVDNIDRSYQIGILPEPHRNGSTDRPVLETNIERSTRTIIAHGALDMQFQANGTILMIQNLTWNGAQGFQTKPAEPLYVPYHTELKVSTMAGSGVMGTTHTERGLTFAYVALAGHMLPQDQPAVAYRLLEFLLGRVDSLSSRAPFTTDSGVAQSRATMGSGTAPPI